MSKDKDAESEDKIGESSRVVSLPHCPVAACEEGQGICAHLMVVCSILLIIITLPFSLMFVVKVVQVGNSPRLDRSDYRKAHPLGV